MLGEYILKGALEPHELPQIEVWHMILRNCKKKKQNGKVINNCKNSIKGGKYCEHYSSLSLSLRDQPGDKIFRRINSALIPVRHKCVISVYLWKTVLVLVSIY